MSASQIRCGKAANSARIHFGPPHWPWWPPTAASRRWWTSTFKTERRELRRQLASRDASITALQGATPRSRQQDHAPELGQGEGTVHGRRGAVVQVHAVQGALSGHHALQHVEGRLVCLVGKIRGQQALQRCDAASVRRLPSVVAGPPPLLGAQLPAPALSSFEASSAVTWLSRDWMAAALLLEVPCSPPGQSLERRE